MEQKKKFDIWKIILAIPFVLLALGKLIDLGELSINFLKNIFSGMNFKSILTMIFGIGNFGYGFIYDILLLAIFAVFAFCIFMKKKDMILFIAAAAYMVVEVIDWLVGFFTNSYKVYNYDYIYSSSYVESPFKFNIVTAFPRFAQLLIPLVILVLVAAFTLKNMDKVQGIVKKLWFVPAVAVFLHDMVLWLVTIICLIARWRWFGAIISYGNLNFQSVLSAFGHIIGFFVMLVAAAALGIYLCEPFKKKEVVEEIVEEVVEEAVEETVEE